MFEGGLDISLMVVLGYFLLRGLFRGVVKEVVAVLGIFIAFWGAGLYYPLAEEHLKVIFNIDGQRKIISFILVFMVVYFLISIISVFFDKIVKLAISPVISSLLGGVIGVLKGGLICGILLSGAETFLKPDDKFFTDSQIRPWIQPVTEQAKAWMSQELRAAITARRSPALPKYQSESAGQPPAAPLSTATVDWPAIQKVLAARPEEISPAWREKLKNIGNAAAFTEEDKKRFISEHPNLFSSAPSAPPRQGAAAPSWPQPATE
ncbi:MAG: CvpA family protein [Candidatus Adiutrix sp.]|jgi:membrane protein required for colicin V production|nr:CvpA family protein [Candidatus Adiutrix sp.]